MKGEWCLAIEEVGHLWTGWAGIKISHEHKSMLVMLIREHLLDDDTRAVLAGLDGFVIIVSVVNRYVSLGFEIS